MSPESLRGWQEFAKKHNTNPSALAEAIGLDLARQAHLAKSKLSPRLSKAIDESKAIAHRRSRRGRGEDEG